MAGSQDDSIMDLLKDFIPRQDDLQEIAGKLDSDGISVRTLLALSKKNLRKLIDDYFPEGSRRGARWGFESAIESRKKLMDETGVHAEGEPLSRKRKPSQDVASMITEVAATTSYFEKLLEPPAELPGTVDQLKAFLSLISAKLPIRKFATFLAIHQPELVSYNITAAESDLAGFCDIVFKMMNHPCPENKVSSSSELSFVTGQFLRFLNDEAPANRQLLSMRFKQDSANRSTTSAASQPLKSLLRPDFQLFVKNCLILRWENKKDETLLAAAVHENIDKLKAWSPLFYGKLPYVIGGCCGGRQFRWLKLFPKGEKIGFEFISDAYDLNMLSGIVKFLHSTIRMHCLLQKLQENIDCAINVALYTPLERSYGGEVTVYPELVIKKIPILNTAKWTVLNSLYESIAGSRYLIQRESFRKTKNRITMQLKPVGDPLAKPDNLGDLRNAIHDMLNGLADLHGKGYTHRDLRWDNCIKVNDMSDWKWVIIDLETAGRDNEVWAARRLMGWDAETLEKHNDKSKRYTKGSDMYQLGKLIAEWLNDDSGGGKEERQVLKSWANKLRQERTAAVKLLADVCKEDCERCRMFGTRL